MRKPPVIQIANLAQVCRDSLVVRKTLMRTLTAGSQGTGTTPEIGVTSDKSILTILPPGTLNVVLTCDRGCLHTKVSEAIMAKETRTSITLLKLWSVWWTRTEKGMQRMEKRMMLARATLADSLVGLFRL